MPVSPAISGADTAFLPLQRTGGRPLPGPGGDGEAAFRDLLPAAAPSAPAAAMPPAAVFEGTDALAQLRQDLLAGASVVETAAAVPADGPYLSAPPVSPADPAVAPVADPVLPPDPAGVPESAEDAVKERRQVSWRNDEFKGRRLGDNPVAGEDGGDWLFGEDGFTFGDLIDVINPLQHLPVVSSIYRWVTGDEISPAATMAGGALFGGPLGLAGAVASVAIEEATGDDLGGHAMAMLFGEDPATGGEGPGTAVADAAPVGSGEATGAAPVDMQAILLPEALEPAAAAPVAFVPAASPQPAPASMAPAIMDLTPEPSAAGPDPAIADQMIQALHKYEALLLSREAAGGSLYDTRL